MITRAPFLKTRYGGYLHRAVPVEDAELTHVGPDTPCGEYMRRFWQPICLSDDLRDLPQRTTLLGEELVVFRDRSGAVGVLELHCPHRGASLEFGQIEGKGIRCCYHGWLIAADGTILDAPTEPAESSVTGRLYHGAYPTHEHRGIVFVYMGPPDRQPAFPVYDSFVRPGYRMMPGRKYFYPCNWLQIMENAMDPVHTAFLHTIISGAIFTNEFGILPEVEFAETPIGVTYIATRRVGDNVWTRMVDAILPNLQQVPPIWEDGRAEHSFSGPMISRWIVPMDDIRTMFIEFRHVSETEGVTPAWWGDRTNMPLLPGQLAADTYEAAQRQPGDYEAQVSQRPIAVHGLEHLGTSDRGVAMFRKQTQRGIRAVQAGRDPSGLGHESGPVIPTYCSDTVMRMPPDTDSARDRQRLRETGRRLAESYVKNPPLLAEAVH